MAKPKEPEGQTTICRNRRATHDYAVTDTLECGLVLVGTEVKSLRDGHATIDEAYARIDGREVWLIGAEIPEYLYGNRQNHKPKRPRKLLLHRREIEKLERETTVKGMTLVVTRIYWKNGRIKFEIGVAKGKKLHDKRETEKKRDWDREKGRLMRHKVSSTPKT